MSNVRAVALINSIERAVAREASPIVIAVFKGLLNAVPKCKNMVELEYVENIFLQTKQNTILMGVHEQLSAASDRLNKVTR